MNIMRTARTVFTGRSPCWTWWSAKVGFN
jgi:hypothetical protein